MVGYRELLDKISKFQNLGQTLLPDIYNIISVAPPKLWLYIPASFGRTAETFLTFKLLF
jgi:hypothetical protein